MLFDWIDDPQKWTENIAPPAIAPSLAKELALAGGTDAQGNASFRLVWGQDFETARVWDRYSQDWFPRYWYRTIRTRQTVENPSSVLALVRFQHKLVGIPRFFVECRLEPEAFFATGAQAGVDSDGQVFHEARCDPHGEWWTFLECCEHRDGCCAYANSLSSTCHGRFRMPGGQDLQAVRAYRQWLAAQADADPRKPVTASMKEKAFRAVREQERQNREMLERELEYASRNFVNTHFHTLSDDPKVATSGKYHFQF